MDPEKLLDGRLKLRHLVLLTTIAEHGSVMRAAEHLRVTQPVVTRGLRELEAILGAEVFERGPRGVTPTVCGEAFIGHAQVVLAHIRKAGQHVAELNSGQVGTVTVGTHLAGAGLLLPKAITRLKRERPRVTVVVKEAPPDVLLADLMAGQVDLTVGRLNASDPGGRTRQIQLYSEPVKLVTRAGHPAQSLAAPRLADLMHFPWSLPVANTSLRREVERVFFEAELPLPEDRVECTSILTLRTLLEESDTVATLPVLIPQRDDRLAVLPTPLPSVSRLVGVTLPHDRAPSPSTQALLQHLRDVAAEIRGMLRPVAGAEAGTGAGTG